MKCHKNKLPAIIAAVLAVAAALCLAACSKEQPSQDLGTNTPDTVSSAEAAVSGTAVPVSTADVSASDQPAEVDWYSGLAGEQLAIADMIISSTDAFNAEDVDRYMSFISTDSAGYKSTREDTAELFDNYQLIATVDDVEFSMLNEEKGIAEVTVTQTTVRDGKEGKGFAPVQNVLSHKLVRKDGRWLFDSTTVVSRRELTHRWDMFIEFASRPPVSSADAPEASSEEP